MRLKSVADGLLLIDIVCDDSVVEFFCRALKAHEWHVQSCVGSRSERRSFFLFSREAGYQAQRKCGVIRGGVKM